MLPISSKESSEENFSQPQSPGRTKRNHLPLLHLSSSHGAEAHTKQSDIGDKKWQHYAPFLRSNPVFSSLVEGKEKQMANLLKVEKVKHGTTLFKQGDQCKDLYLIYSGSIVLSVLVSRSGASKVVKVLEGGKTIGEMSLFTKEMRSATATAIGKVVLLRFDKEKFELLFDELLYHRPLSCRGIVSEIAERLEACNAAHPGLQIRTSRIRNENNPAQSPGEPKISFNEVREQAETLSQGLPSCLTRLITQEFRGPPRRPDPVEFLFQFSISMLDEPSDLNELYLRQKIHEFFLEKHKTFTFASLIKLIFATTLSPGLDNYQQRLMAIYKLLVPEDARGNHPEIIEYALILKWIRTFGSHDRKAKLSEQLPLLWERLQLVKGCSLFRHLLLEEKIHIAATTKKVQLPVGTNLFKQGDEGDAMYIVESGEMMVHIAEKTLAYLIKRDCFGEMSLIKIKEGQRNASLTANEDTTLLKITKESFTSCLVRHPNILKGLYNEFAQRIRQFNEVLATAAGRQEDDNETSNSSEASDEKDSLTPVSPLRSIGQDLPLFRLPAFTADLAAEAQDERGYHFCTLVDELGSQWKKDQEFAKVLPVLTKLYTLEWQWKQGPKDTNTMNKMDIEQVLRAIHRDGFAMIDCIKINDKVFYRQDPGAAPLRMDQGEFLISLFQELYQSKLSPHRTAEEVKRDVEKFLIASSLAVDSEMSKAKDQLQREFLTSNPIPCLDILRGCTINAWGFADTLMRTQWFTPLYQAPFCMRQLPGFLCHFRIEEPGHFSVIQSKIFAVYNEDEFLANRSEAVPLAVIPFQWELKSSNGNWVGMLRIPKDPGIMPGKKVEDYAKVIKFLAGK